MHGIHRPTEHQALEIAEFVLFLVMNLRIGSVHGAFFDVYFRSIGTRGNAPGTPELTGIPDTNTRTLDAT